MVAPSQPLGEVQRGVPTSMEQLELQVGWQERLTAQAGAKPPPPRCR